MNGKLASDFLRVHLGQVEDFSFISRLRSLCKLRMGPYFITRLRPEIMIATKERG
jgi:hypothetical protein